MIDAASFRRVPVGVLVLGVLLLFLGAGLLLAPGYLLLSGAEGRHLGWATMGASGAVAVHLAVALLRMRHWAWTTVVVLLILLLGSSVLRGVASDEPPLGPLAEIGAEVLSLGYLVRRPVRDAFRPAT